MMRRTKKRRKARKIKAGGIMMDENSQQQNGEVRVDEPNAPTTPMKSYASWRYPYLKLGLRVRFENGFFQTRDPELQDLVERSEGFGLYLADITAIVDLKCARPEKSVYCSFEHPSLAIGHVRFIEGALITEDFEIKRLVSLAPGFGKEIREIEDSLVSLMSKTTDVNEEPIQAGA